jgi:hypothetical protein
MVRARPHHRTPGGFRPCGNDRLAPDWQCQSVNGRRSRGGALGGLSRWRGSGRRSLLGPLASPASRAAPGSFTALRPFGCRGRSSGPLRFASCRPPPLTWERCGQGQYTTFDCDRLLPTSMECCRSALERPCYRICRCQRGRVCGRTRLVDGNGAPAFQYLARRRYCVGRCDLGRCRGHRDDRRPVLNKRCSRTTFGGNRELAAVSGSILASLPAQRFYPRGMLWPSPKGHGRARSGTRLSALSAIVGSRICVGSLQSGDRMGSHPRFRGFDRRSSSVEPRIQAGARAAGFLLHARRILPAYRPDGAYSLPL